jgi:putative ABC transport system substrate-binding protein
MMQFRLPVRLLAAAWLLLACTTATLAQAPETRPWRLAVLATTPLSLEVTRTRMLPALARLGFIEGRNLGVAMHWADIPQLPDTVRAILLERPDVIFTTGSDTTQAVRALSSTLPIVYFGADPVGQGFAESLARPGGMVTGIAILASELEGKRLDMLHQALPGRRRVGALIYAPSPDRPASEREMRRAAGVLGLELQLFNVAGRDDYPAAFAAMRAAGIEALLIMATPQLFGDASQLAAMAREARLPTICEWASMAASGCLLGYGPDIDDLRRRAAIVVARILRGVPPGEIPIELPTRFTLGVNLGTAQALGVTLPAALMAQADAVFD